MSLFSSSLEASHSLLASLWSLSWVRVSSSSVSFLKDEDKIFHWSGYYKQVEKICLEIMSLQLSILSFLKCDVHTKFSFMGHMPWQQSLSQPPACQRLRMWRATWLSSMQSNIRSKFSSFLIISLPSVTFLCLCLLRWWKKHCTKENFEAQF